MSDSRASVEINIRSPRYFIACTRGVCRHCKDQTNLFALALPPGHETLDVDGDLEADAELDAWLCAEHHAFLFHVEFLSANVEARLASLARSFRIDRQDSATESAWTNHCEMCGISLDDEGLFCEPGEAFFPTTEASASVIRLLPIAETLEASAGGYSFDPNFFHAMSLE